MLIAIICLSIALLATIITIIILVHKIKLLKEYEMMLKLNTYWCILD